MDSLENWNNRIELPKDFEWISNEKEFYDVYEKIQNWYGEDLHENEKKIIKETWNRWCKEYGWQFNTTRLAILWNRIDTWIFEFRYPKFINIDKNIIRKINDTNRQRKFREVAIKLIKKYNNLFDSDIKIVEAEFNNAFINKKTPTFDIIDDKINQNKWKKNQNKNEINSNNNENIQDNNLNNFNWNNDSPQSNYNDVWPSDDDVETMLNLKISPFFEWIKKEIFANDLFSTSPNKKYLEWFFNECANNIFELYGDIKDSDELKEELLTIFKQHFYTISQWIEKSSNELTSDIKNKIIDMKPGDSLAILVNNAFDKDDKIDYSKFIKIEELTQEDKDAIDYLYNKITGNNHTKEEITNQYLKYKHLEKKQKNWELSEREKKDFKWLKELFKQIKRLKKLEDIRHNEYVWNHEYHVKNVYASVEYATWNIKDIHPIAIVENNTQINNYIYWNKETQCKLDFNNLNLSIEDKIRLFDKLKKQKQTDIIFEESAKYLNNDLSINENLVNLSWINMQNIIDNQRKIENMVKDLALQENLEKHDKKDINEINVRKATMVCCFRAISSFFNTVNDNGENFASEFEIQDVNKNIEFDEKSWVIKMTGTIWANKNHIWLYYNTNTWELSFDNFLAYDSEFWYKIWKWNWETEKLNIKLPTMDQMESTAKSINFNLIDNLTFNMRQYNRTVWFAMNESIRFNCFKWFMWADMDVNKNFVEQFNEKNILKQDIIKTIYSKFYNKNYIDEQLSDCLLISEWEKPAQFKLIKLISDSIDNYESANQLLQFRNYINKLDEFISSKDIIKKDRLLTLLFANDLSNNADILDNSIDKMKNENRELSISDDYKHTYEYFWSNKENGNFWEQDLNYYIFLNLLSENKWDKRIINLDEFEFALNNIEKSDRNLIDNASKLLKQNYEEFKNKNDLAYLETKIDDAYLW